MRGPHKVHKFASAGIISICTEKCGYRKRSSDRNCLFIPIFLFRFHFGNANFALAHSIEIAAVVTIFDNILSNRLNQVLVTIKSPTE